MGARPSQFKKGGGFLNGVDGVISGYEFTDEFNGVAFKPGKDPKTKKDRFHSLYTVLSVRVDGADEDVTTTLFTGGADDFEITEDGHTLVPVEDGRELGAGTGFAKLITSLVEAGFPETNLPEDKINYEAIIGTRVRFVQRTNVEDTKKLGKRKAKDGKEYDRQDLVIDQVYDLPSAEAKTNGKAATPAGKATKPATGTKTTPKGKDKSAAEPETDIKDLSGTTLVDILSEQEGQKIVKSKLSMKVLTKLMKHPRREDVRKWLFSDDNLEELATDGLIAYNKAKQTITAAA